MDGEKVYKAGEDYVNIKKLEITSYTANGSKVDVTFTNPAKEKYTIIISDYEDGKLNNTDIITQEFDVGVNTVTSTKNINLGKDDKIMLWHDLTSLKPGCNAEIVK